MRQRDERVQVMNGQQWRDAASLRVAANAKRQGARVYSGGERAATAAACPRPLAFNATRQRQQRRNKLRCGEKKNGRKPTRAIADCRACAAACRKVDRNNERERPLRACARVGARAGTRRRSLSAPAAATTRRQMATAAATVAAIVASAATRSRASKR